MVRDDHCTTILQRFLVDRAIRSADLTELIELITDSSIDNDVIVNAINQRIGGFCQKIVKTNCEVTGEKTYVLISTAEPSGIKSFFNKDQIDYFHHIMNGIITSSGALPRSSALNTASTATMGRVSMLTAETFLDLFITKRLLVEEGDYLFLSPLTVAEFGPYITENYEVSDCILCRKTVVYGDRCPNCSNSVHNRCLEEFTSSSDKTAKCPQCKQEWKEN